MRLRNFGLLAKDGILGRSYGAEIHPCEKRESELRVLLYCVLNECAVPFFLSPSFETLDEHVFLI